MGRTSKFSFPIPGRKRTPNKDSVFQPASTSSKTTQANVSKAEEFLGTGSVAPGEWRVPGSRNSGMSIQSSQSTKSVNDNGSNIEHRDGESGIFSRRDRLKGKASSNILGQRFGDDTATDTSSARRLRNEDSTSTLKSAYDRNKTPLIISQQTSASASRDLALRKGLSPLVNSSPLLHAESQDHWHESRQRFGMDGHASAEKDRKKSGKLGLTSLFRSGKKAPGSDNFGPSESKPANLTHHSSIRNRLKKASSKESLQSQTTSVHSNWSSRDHKDQTNDSTPHNVQGHHDRSPMRNAPMRSIPESGVPQTTLNPQLTGRGNDTRPNRIDPDQLNVHRRLETLNPEPPEREPFSWKNVRSGIRTSVVSSSTGNSSLGVTSSGASLSSHNTKTSRQTGGSIFSSADLQQNSILSLSSDSEEDLSDSEPSKSRDNISIGRAPSHAESEIIPPALQHRLHPSSRNPARRPPPSALKGSPSNKMSPTNQFLAIPEIPIPQRSVQQRPPPPTRQDSIKSQGSIPMSSSRKGSVSSRKSSQQQPTPPLSPKSANPRDVPTPILPTPSIHTPSGRMMSVTKQEEALLEALRKKRARMREKIIEEHETGKSPPRVPERASSRFSKASSTDTIRAGTERVPLYLDAPSMKARQLNYEDGEPSPGLSDFMVFASDDDSTPTNSRAPTRMGHHPNASLSSITQSEVRIVRPNTPPSQKKTMKVVVGEAHEKDHVKGHGRKTSLGVRFVGEVQYVDAEDYILDEGVNSSDERVWGL